jgi:hypothetical protein
MMNVQPFREHGTSSTFIQSGVLLKEGRDLISDQLKQYGPSFPNPVDVYIDVGSGNVKVHSEKKASKKTRNTTSTWQGMWQLGSR